jgi:DNA polymerase III delta prime subunit
MVWYEALNDQSMSKVWSETKLAHPEAEYTEISAAQMNSIDEFSSWFDQWTTRLSPARVRILLVWHAHCLSASCQQMLRRSMEKRSFKCRVWFHIEEPSSLQSAILSRCIVRKLNPHAPRSYRMNGIQPTIWKSVWNDPIEMELHLVK